MSDPVIVTGVTAKGWRRLAWSYAREGRLLKALGCWWRALREYHRERHAAG